MRLDKFVMRSTRLTKQQVTTCIESGEVTVNQQVITDVRYQVHENNYIEYQGKQLVPRPFRYLMFNKPVDTICSNVDGDYPSILHYLEIENKDELHIAGRLDADTTGLVLITDDGRWSFNIMRPEMQCEKTYRVTLAKALILGVAERFAEGLLLQGESKPTLPAKLEHIETDPSHEPAAHQVLLTISEGRYHQVKRMFFAVGNKVKQLHREKIGNLTVDIPTGTWRYLTIDEVKSLTY
ncbi:pseudouridine synthase [Shewanella sp. 1_MG-2023]|uniref:pseudouridine synthase n=1 Tax=unclassified Shewanella TaxID=196818 RepID=UPI0026E374F2|nr:MULTISPECIES: pseudouridine synthase [unclassified Shewanella]MDO6612319.1 pseudouridine synthase [Shewanella sp. 7_MG-2023]MDO6772173.1 pseudouridine synthase [Shewanella sp. 2_MG-2023]MDO6794079.1 pseudouridine synthase [Shewanella sp. 1_MG-2023]